jgi:hypothetical protein
MRLAGVGTGVAIRVPLPASDGGPAAVDVDEACVASRVGRKSMWQGHIDVYTDYNRLYSLFRSIKSICQP